MNKRYENNDTNLKKIIFTKSIEKYIIIYISKKGLREESHGELMMRMMRKMFKRIVSIVMALLVILGTAVYGGSVFADEAQGQADSGTTSLDSGYIYLNPEGMNLNSESHWCNWTEGQDKVYFGIVQSNYAVKEGEYDSTAKLWKWKIENLNLPSSGTVNLFFTYSNDWEGKIKKKPYYRTAEYTMEVSSIGGKVFVQNGPSDDPIDSQNVYALKELPSYAGKTLSVVDMTGSGIGIKALFSTDGSNFDTANAIDMTGNKVTIPENGVYPYQYVKFITNDNTELLASTKIEDAINNGSILYYGIRTDSGVIKSVWSKDKKNSSEPTIKKLYFNKNSFDVNDKVQVKIGTGEYENVIVDPEDHSILSYDLTRKTLSSDTIIEVKKGNTIYRFYPNGNLSLVTIDSDGNAGLRIYRNNPSGTYTVYYDATLSKLSYKDTDGVKNDGKGIPYPDNAAKVYYYATNGTNTKTGEMELDNKEGYPDVYKVDLPYGYDQVRFAAYEVTNEEPSKNGDATDLVTIPGNLMNPCYYGDSSDDVIYNGGNRGGYWDEAYTVRDPEKEAEQHSSKDVVDINDEGKFTRNASTLYVNSTFYDYYTDYELNGKNRDDYDSNNPAAGSQRSYVTFRQFDQALSDYYKNKKVSIPIYTGHFQPDYTDSNGNKWGNPFYAIAETLDLYGYNKDNQSGFMSTNNSTLSADGKSTYYDAAAQGLVANALSDENNLMTSNNEVLEPHFNEEFLTGNNSKRTALAKVYKNVSFPFTKQKLDGDGNKSNDGVEYWYFDSADTTLAMRTDKGSYYLKDVGKQDWSKNVNSSSKTDDTYGFFPFNEKTKACSASNYNYGFGTKLEFKFRLTEDGKVVGTDENEYPIKFNFSGDDDVWVYVDGNLALDVGGAHGRVTGQIDFSGTDTNKKATVTRTKKSLNKSSIEGNKTPSSFKIKGSNSDEHTLTMFYMERGMWESNMKVSFNFPDENEFAVEKKVDTTGVNTELFPTSLFEGASVFPFTIQNQATHYGAKEAQSPNAKQPITYNDSFSPEKLSSASPQNTFEFVDSNEGQSKVVHWKAKRDDAEGTYVDKRVGIIQPATGKTFNASDTNAFLQFKMYYDYPDIPGLASTYLELEDDSGKKINGYLSGKTYGNSSLVQKKWNTIQVDLSKLQGDKKFDYSKIKYIKFNYNFARDIYLDDFKFIPSVVAATKTGFVTQQENIPDYGSATSGTLKYPKGAQYTLSKNDGSSKLYRIDSDGKFALADGETATFSDQFRRGSYIAVSEDVNSSVFDTTWTLYENGQAVSTMETGNTVENEDPNLPSVQNVKSNTIRDGRKEKHMSGQNNGVEISNSGYTTTGYAKNQDGNTVNENTIVFRSYADPNNQTTMTKLKATFVNKVKTGKIEIWKKAAEGSGELNGTYTFRVEFSNVAGLSLEPQKIVKEYTIKAGGSVTINGIPAGTDYRISENESKDGSTLESVIVNNNNSFDAGYDPVTKVVAGKVIASSDMTGTGIKNPETSSDATIITFKNTLKPTINLNLTKEWKNTNNITLPDSIKIRLQRSSNDGKSWETVEYDGKNKTITLIPYYDGKWSYSFNDLNQYVDYKANPKVPYIYRVVEVSGDDESETEIESGGYLNDKYKVTYSDNVDCSKISTGTTESFTITNTYSPKTNIKITKQDASTKKLLGGVEFKLEKMKEDTSTKTLVVDNSFAPQFVTTSDSGSTLGIAEFKDLEDGTYRLTETKTVAGYNLLKDPITIKINRNQENGTTVDGQSYDFNKASDKNTIELQISNRMKFLLPKTGGYGAMLFILCGMALATLCCLIFFLINLRKEVQYSRHKRQRKNAIGK